jgi:hypothetical protein
MDLMTKNASLFEIAGLTPPTPPKAAVERDTSDAIDTELLTFSPAEKLPVQVALAIPAGYKLNELAPVTWEIFTDSEQPIFPADSLDQRDEAVASADDHVTFDLPMTKEPGTAMVYIRVSYGFCGKAANALCRLATATWRVPVSVAAEGTDERLELSFPVVRRP